MRTVFMGIHSRVRVRVVETFRAKADRPRRSHCWRRDAEGARIRSRRPRAPWEPLRRNQRYAPIHDPRVIPSLSSSHSRSRAEDLKLPAFLGSVCRHSSIGRSSLGRRPRVFSAADPRVVPREIRGHAVPTPRQPKPKAKAAFGTQAVGTSRANAKPHRRRPKHEPLSREQVAFRAARALAQTQKNPWNDCSGPSAPDVAARVASEAEARLAAAEAGAKKERRGGRGYFAAKGRRDASEASLAGLDLADEETVRELLGRLPAGHLEERSRLMASFAVQYSRWWQLLQSEFSVLLYGFGSKKDLLEDFARKTLTDGGVVVVNGFFPGLTAKHILANAAAAVSRENPQALHQGSNDALFRAIAAATRDRGGRSRSRRESSDSRLSLENRSAEKSGRLTRGRRATTERAISSDGFGNDAFGVDGDDGGGMHDPETRDGDFQPAKRLYVVLHNIDGQQLRSPEAQAVLGELASMPRVHLIASVDHVNAPLLWSKREAARFNWVWHSASTFASYAIETSFAPQLLASRGEERHIRGAVNVLRSLTSNARDIFRVLAEFQIQNPEDKGMGFHAFYTECRSQFLATSEVTLRSHLTEFVDHELTRTRKGSDGEDVVHAPFASDVLAQLLREIQHA